jgi:hypothetical protein
MGATVDISKITATFNSVAIPEVLDVTMDGISQPAIDTSSMDTAAVTAAQLGNRTAIPARLRDAGTVVINAHYDPDTVPPMGTNASLEVAFAASGLDATGADYTGNAILTDVSFGLPLNDKMTLNYTFKWSGIVTHTAGAV